MKHHVFGVTNDAGSGDELWHVPLGDELQPAFSDVDSQTGARPWLPESVVDVACAADSASNLQVLLVTGGGRLWHTVRAKNGFWTTHSLVTNSSFGNVGKAVPGETGRFKAVAAFTVDKTLHVLAVTDDQKLYEATRAEEAGKGDPRRRHLAAVQAGRLAGRGPWQPADRSRGRDQRRVATNAQPRVRGP